MVASRKIDESKSTNMKSNNKVSRYPMILISISCILGMILSIYAYHVETTAHSDPKYKALCDISARISCTKVFSSRYGTGFGLVEHVLGKDSVFNQPNSVTGMIFYIINAVLAFNMSGFGSTVQLTLASLGTAGCVYLAYILVFILGDICVICISTYILNGLVLLGSILKYNAVKRLETSRSKKSSNESKKRR